ncbi:tripartite tricarboxylate transporter TctB family protein [Roseateles depolymerans]|uniref:Tripartite tricarboxylate transporter TctB n=1 Tax=Roseateles depolymerans TaxID=76731 RepID=A0A0U3CHR6_9BURK|nr:tripartite tricarboxylate transporter TctB family protein [Roseateles depolymerans]ALV08216.1 tripartite tricarboxylate transporter TctB [Roseateles depolymerans]REG21559.1 tripartite tricarboxylate transporter TctB family protein [Roseateles depolymerans]
MNRHLARGLFLALVALGFGLGSFRYTIGRLDHAGPGLFPLAISVMLLLVALATMARALVEPSERLELKVSNIGLILGSLCAFALVSKLVNMSAGIVVMVFLATAAGRDYSWLRNVKISAGLLAIAFGFQKLLGLNLPLL